MYDHVPKSVETSYEGKAAILMNQEVRTDRSIPNNKPDNIIRDNKIGTDMLIDVTIPGDFKIQRPYIRNSAHVECESKSDTVNNRGDWNHFNITHIIPQQHTRKARN